MIVNNYSNSVYSTIYNEGKIQKFENKSSVSLDSKDFERILACTRESDLNTHISNIKQSKMNSREILRESQKMQDKYGIPSIYGFLALIGCGNLEEDTNGKISFKMDINKLNIGTKRQIVWDNNGNLGITFSKNNGSSIMALDDDEINCLFDQVDLVNEESKELIKKIIEEYNEKIKFEN